jgi:hypothetical protein
LDPLKNIKYGLYIDVVVVLPFFCFDPLGLLPFLGMAVARPDTRSSTSNFMARKSGEGGFRILKL